MHRERGHRWRQTIGVPSFLSYSWIVQAQLYTRKQQVRHGSVRFSFASYRVASYCGRQKIIWSLLWYWTMAKKKKNSIAN